MIKAIVVDDEPHARDLLVAMLEREHPQAVDVVATCDDLAAAVAAIHKYRPDAVFLDIEMPGNSGLEIMDFFEPHQMDFDVVFVTAFSQFALNAIRLSAVDYLLKPLQSEHLAEAVERLGTAREKRQAMEVLQTLRHNLNQQAQPRVVVPTSEGKYFFDLEELVCFKAAGAYTEVFSTNKRKLFVGKNLRYFEEMLLAYPQFFRCHRSFLVNLRHVKQKVRGGESQLLLTNGESAEVSKDRNEALLERMLGF